MEMEAGKERRRGERETDFGGSWGVEHAEEFFEVVGHELVEEDLVRKSVGRASVRS
jgi:hypothetical protein